jgi:hypothetical protein
VKDVGDLFQILNRFKSQNVKSFEVKIVQMSNTIELDARDNIDVLYTLNVNDYGEAHKLKSQPLVLTLALADLNFFEKHSLMNAFKRINFEGDTPQLALHGSCSNNLEEVHD